MDEKVLELLEKGFIVEELFKLFENWVVIGGFEKGLGWELEKDRFVENMLFEDEDEDEVNGVKSSKSFDWLWDPKGSLLKAFDGALVENWLVVVVVVVEKVEGKSKLEGLFEVEFWGVEDVKSEKRSWGVEFVTLFWVCTWGKDCWYWFWFVVVEAGVCVYWFIEEIIFSLEGWFWGFSFFLFFEWIKEWKMRKREREGKDDNKWK